MTDLHALQASFDTEAAHLKVTSLRPPRRAPLVNLPPRPEGEPGLLPAVALLALIALTATLALAALPGWQ